MGYFYYTIFKKQFASLYTDPIGKPAGVGGIFIIDKLFTNVEQDLFAVMLDPIINVLFWDCIELNCPPKIPELVDESIILAEPPFIVEQLELVDI